MLLSAVSCGPNYYTIAPGFAVYTEPVLGNVCNPEYGSEVRAAAHAINLAAKELEILNHWPPNEVVKVCVIDRLPFVQCGRLLAGCAWSDRALVSTQWAPDSYLLRKSYDWRHTLIHELTGSLILQDVLDLPKSELEFIVTKAYKDLQALTYELAFENVPR